jgi:uncharacterized protein (UPF0335 family)
MADPRTVKASDNSAPTDDVGGIAANQLKQFVDRIERLEEEKKALQEDIKEVYAEAKGRGFDIKILRKIIALRKKDQAELDEEEALLDVYKRALGMIPGFEEEAQNAAE